jgi:predicted peroxiredoxin
MRAFEFLNEADAPKQLGRAFNHLEDLVFFHGSQGTLEALSHIKDFSTPEGAGSIRMKWDGNPQIYWGREQKGGPLMLAGHNGWARGAKGTSPEEVKDFIQNKSGNPKTPEEQSAREQFAQEFANLYPLFDSATPKDFVGFVYADGLFLKKPELDQQGVYNFCPNPNSQTCYHVRADSELGKRIGNAQVMVVGHAFFPEFGMPDSSQKPISDFSKFNSNSSLIVLGPVYNSKPVQVDMSAVANVEKYLTQHAKQIDSFLQGTTGLSDLKNIIYTFVNQTAKAKKLDGIDANLFYTWLGTSKVSAPKQEKIKALAQQNENSLEAIFTLVKMIMDMKDQVIDQVEGEQGDVWDTHGEGRVRYADQNKQFGNVKLVPRKRWTPT